MSEFFHVARPYAKAAFELAIEHQNIDHWQAMITFISEVAKNDQMEILFSGVLTSETIAELFIEICGERLDQNGKNLIRVMAENNRLNILSDVLEQFVHLRKTKLNTEIEIKIVSSNKLNKKQLSKISNAMRERLSRNVKLHCKIEKSIIAGVIIHLGDIIIDGSIRGRLERLKNVLQS